MTGYRLNIGPVAKTLLARAHKNSANMVYVADYRELRAARKLVKRGWLVQYETSPVFFLTEVWDE